jgi:hypothetical protein
MRWAQTIALLLATLTLGAGQPATEQTSRADWSKALAELRKQVHITTKQVPPYPEDAESLLDVRNWPPTRVVGGTPYTKRVTKYSEGYCAQYVWDPSGTRWEVSGPSYCWRSDSTLYQRSYSAHGRTETWYYSRRGGLCQYRSGDIRPVVYSELYAPGGTLVGLEVLPGTKRFWKGVAVERGEYERRKAEFYESWQTIDSSFAFRGKYAALFQMAGQPTIDKPEGADWSKIPPEHRALMHMNVKSLPPYPVEPDSFLDIQRWPRRTRFDGKDFDLEYFESQYDVAMKPIRSPSEVDSGWSYGAHYVRKSRDGKREGARGPFYEWYPDGSIWGRSYITPSMRQERYYDREGNLRVCDFWTRGSGCSPAKSSHELFDTEGFLVGCSMFRIKKYYWRGSEVDGREYIRLQGIFYKW